MNRIFIKIEFSDQVKTHVEALVSKLGLTLPALTDGTVIPVSLDKLINTTGISPELFAEFIGKMFEETAMQPQNMYCIKNESDNSYLKYNGKEYYFEPGVKMLLGLPKPVAELAMQKLQKADPFYTFSILPLIEEIKKHEQ